MKASQPERLPLGRVIRALQEEHGETAFTRPASPKTMADFYATLSQLPDDALRQFTRDLFLEPATQWEA